MGQIAPVRRLEISFATSAIWWTNCRINLYKFSTEKVMNNKSMYYRCLILEVMTNDQEDKWKNKKINAQVRANSSRSSKRLKFVEITCIF